MSVSKMPKADRELEIRYDQKPALYTSQFMIHAGAEEVLLDCTSGVTISDDKTIVPVHTKLALSWEAVARLATLLNETLEQRVTDRKSIPTPHIPTSAAKLPTFGEPSTQP